MASLGDSIERRIEFIDRLQPLTGTLRDALVLDLGCGRHALWSRAYAGRGARVLAIEIDPVRCREAVGRLAAALASGSGRVLAVTRGDGERLPVATAAVDFVHCAQVL